MKSLVTFAIGSLALAIAPLALAASPEPLQVPAGVYGEPTVATLVTTSSATEITFPCEVATFASPIFIPSASGGAFSISGELRSVLVGSPATPVTLTGVASSCEKDGVCFTSVHSISAILTDSDTGRALGSYTFVLGEKGPSVTCQ